MQEGHMQADARDPDSKHRRASDAVFKETSDGQNRHKADRHNAPEMRDQHFEKVVTTSIVTTKKTMVDLVNLSQDEPISEVERMIQHKKLQKKLSGQGSSTSEQNHEGTSKPAIEALSSENDILQEFRGVEMEDSLTNERGRANAKESKSQENKKTQNSADKTVKRNFNDDYEGDDDGFDDPMMGIWDGPKAEVQHKDVGERHEERNFQTGSFQKDYNPDVFSFSKDNNSEVEMNEAGGRYPVRGGMGAMPLEEGSTEIGGMNSFQMMKMKNQASMSSAQIIKYHNFVSKRAKKVFASLLKGYSPV